MFNARRFVGGVLVLSAVAFTACGPTVAISKESVPVGSARVIPLSGNNPASSPTDRIVAHAQDGWHVFLG